MAVSMVIGCRIAAIGTCVPTRQFDNVKETTEFPAEDVRKVVAMAGVSRRRIAGDSICASDLCVPAARSIIDALKWDPGSIDALIMVTQTPDYFLPSMSCMIHKHLGLSETCATFDVGMGCSGYPYGIWLASRGEDMGSNLYP